MPHLQGFVQMNEKQRITAMIKLIRRAHWEKRRGTPYEAAHYCMKPDLENNCDCKHCYGVERFDIQPAVEDGCISAETQWRTHEVARIIKVHGLSRAITRFPEMYMGMARGMQALETFYSPKRDWETQVTIVWGAAGTGKTRYAMQAFPSPYKLAVFGEGTDFFGDYRPQEHQTVVADDYYSSWKYTTWLAVCDRYPTEVHTKGGFLQFLARDMVFTSNLSPDEWYKVILAEPARRDSFFRRIHNIIHFVSRDTYVVTKVKLLIISSGESSLCCS